MKLRMFILLIALLSTSNFVEAKKVGFGKVEALFKKKLKVSGLNLSAGDDTNSGIVFFSTPRSGTVAIDLEYNNSFDQLLEGTELTTATTGTVDTPGVIRLNMTASKNKSTDSSIETIFYTTSNDDQSSVKDVSIEILKLPTRTGEVTIDDITLKIKATFDNVRAVTTASNGDELAVERVNDIKVTFIVRHLATISN